jgi:hypothetical protein
MALLQKTGSAAGPTWAEKPFWTTTIVNDATLLPGCFDLGTKN